MSQKALKLNDIINYVSPLPFADFNKMVHQYANDQRVDVADTMNFVMVSNFEERLAKLGVNSSCPQCSSTSISKYGVSETIFKFLSVKIALNASHAFQEQSWRKQDGTGTFGLKFLK